MNRAYLLGLVLALALLPSNVVAAAVPLLRPEWHASAAEAGWVFAAYQVGYAVSVLVLLPLTDRIRMSRIIAFSTIATSISFVLFALLAHDVWSAAAFRFLAGLGLAGIYLPGVRVIAAAAPRERRGAAVGGYVSAFYLGAAISLWTTGLLLPHLGWRGAAFVLGAVSLVALPIAKFSISGITIPSHGGRAHLDPAVLRKDPVVRNILAYTGHNWELYVSRGWVAAFIASVLVKEGLDATMASAQGGQWAGLMAAFGMPGVFLGGWLSDRLGRARISLLIALLSGAFSLWFGLLGAAPWSVLIVIGCFYGLLLAADSAIYSTAITEVAPPRQLGSAQSMQAFFGFGAAIVAPIAAGWVLDLGLGWGGAFALAGVVGMGLSLPLLALVRIRSLP